MEFTIHINGVAHRITSVSRLRALAHHARLTRPFIEMWVLTDGPSVGVLINKEYAWLAYYKNPGEEPLISHNPGTQGDPLELIEFRTYMGESEYHPASSCYTTSEAIDALENFLLNGIPTGITWQPN